ncbi:MAG: lysophospholipid acyltransferase family protein [Woeseiaceae bacterium]|nr:lysophospholipid acyltransferase family protein [Woeseiaceae bacterium]
MLWFRGLLFTIVMYGAALVLSATVLILFWAPHSWRWAVAVAWARVCLWAGRVICGLDVSTEGAGNIPDEPCVFLIKHTTALETYWQIAALPASAWVLKKELLYLPVFGWALGLVMKSIAIDRRSGGSAVKQVIEQGKERLASGMSVCIFPEGTRMPPGETRRYGVSGAALAAETGCKIVPVAHNAGDHWPKRGMAKTPGKIRFCIGPPIAPGDRKPKETNLIAQEWVENKMHEISSLYKEKAREE